MTGEPVSGQRSDQSGLRHADQARGSASGRLDERADRGRGHTDDGPELLVRT